MFRRLLYKLELSGSTIKERVNIKREFTGLFLLVILVLTSSTFFGFESFAAASTKDLGIGDYNKFASDCNEQFAIDFNTNEPTQWTCPTVPQTGNKITNVTSNKDAIVVTDVAIVPNSKKY